jgi:hypothetical protein
MKRAAPFRTSYLLCISNEAYTASLELHKIYRRLPDREAQSMGFVRIIDESGEDYLYPATWFMALHLERSVTRELRASTEQTGTLAEGRRR